MWHIEVAMILRTIEVAKVLGTYRGCQAFVDVYRWSGFCGCIETARLFWTYSGGQAFVDVLRWPGFCGRIEVARILGTYIGGQAFVDVLRWPGFWGRIEVARLSPGLAGLHHHQCGSQLSGSYWPGRPPIGQGGRPPPTRGRWSARY